MLELWAPGRTHVRMDGRTQFRKNYFSKPPPTTEIRQKRGGKNTRAFHLGRAASIPAVSLLVGPRWGDAAGNMTAVNSNQGEENASFGSN